MADTRMSDAKHFVADGGDAIEDFAGRVLDVLVARSRRTSQSLRGDLVRALAEGLVTQDETLVERTLAQFRRSCISPVAMADIYVPAAARLLGETWVGDGMSFAEVTIATARLQAMVRAIGTRWGGEPPHSAGRRAVLMVVPSGEDHTLGAVVATGQLRRLGLSVCLRISPAPGEVAELLRSRSFDAAMFSVAGSGKLDASRRLVEALRAFGPAGLPVVAGGALVGAGVDVARATGADFATEEPGEALRLCGLTRVAPGVGSEVAARLRG